MPRLSEADKRIRKIAELAVALNQNHMEQREISVDTAMAITKLANAVHWLDVNDCNDGGLSDKNRKRRDALVKKAEAILKPYVTYFEHQSDPRGCPFKVMFASGANNGWELDKYAIEY